MNENRLSSEVLDFLGLGATCSIQGQICTSGDVSARMKFLTVLKLVTMDHVANILLIEELDIRCCKQGNIGPRSSKMQRSSFKLVTAAKEQDALDSPMKCP